MHVVDALLKIKLSEKKSNVNANDKKGNEISAVGLDKKNSILKTVAAKNVSGLFLKIEKPVFVRFLSLCGRQNCLQKVANFVVVMDVIHVTSMISMNTLLTNIQIIK